MSIDKCRRIAFLVFCGLMFGTRPAAAAWTTANVYVSATGSWSSPAMSGSSLAESLASNSAGISCSSYSNAGSDDNTMTSGNKDYSRDYTWDHNGGDGAASITVSSQALDEVHCVNGVSATGTGSATVTGAGLTTVSRYRSYSITGLGDDGPTTDPTSTPNPLPGANYVLPSTGMGAGFKTITVTISCSSSAHSQPGNGGGSSSGKGTANATVTWSN